MQEAVKHICIIFSFMEMHVAVKIILYIQS